ncbi:MAG: hypothetical protein EXR69_02545 [Myxococcales bacterium]|nr:hypothetical protein [Myxococcales bacterium]
MLIFGLGFAPGAFAAKLTALVAVVSLTTDETAMTACELKGEVAARPPYVLPNDWKVQLQNQAGDLGGTIVLYKPAVIANIGGAAYLCVAASAAESGCSKDTDCKGDRGCDAGACKAP